MAFNHTLSAILRGRWSIDKQWADDHFPLVLLMLKGQPVSFASAAADRTGAMEMEQPFAIDPKTMTRHELYVFDYNRGYIPNPNIPEGSVGMLPVTGPITKYNGECGEAGSIKRTTWLNEMGRRQNIGSVISIFDTPGGESRAGHSFGAALKSFNKPVLGFVDGMSASLGVHYTANIKEVYLSNEMDQMGSVGSYCTIMDFRGLLESNGIKMTEIYAPQSTDKNKDYRDALEGNTQAIEEDLKLHVDSFINLVKSRNSRASKYSKEWSTGKMFYAQKATEIGLAEGILSFDQVVQKAAWNAKRKN